MNTSDTSAHTISLTPGFPGGSLGRDGGRGGGGGGVLQVMPDGVAGRAGDEEPKNKETLFEILQISGG